jgi:hypothetical protein
VDDTIERSLARSNVAAEKRPPTASIRILPGTPALAELTLSRTDTGQIAWTITFEAAQ